jgi:tetratricopeptide (TPR) repeat protein
MEGTDGLGDQRNMMAESAKAGAAVARGAAHPIEAAHRRLVEAERCRRTGDLSRAQALLERLLADHPDYVGALQSLGVIHLSQGRFRQALASFIEAAMHCPGDVVNHTNLATAYLALGAREMAAGALAEARRLAPDDPAVHATLAEVYREGCRYGLAASAYRKVLARREADPEASLGLADCHAHLGETSEAVAVLERAHRARPDHVGLLYALSQISGARVSVDLLAALAGVHREAHRSEEEFLSLKEFTRAAALDRLGRYEDAWACLTRANGREFPRHAPAWQRDGARRRAFLEAAERSPATARAAEGEPAVLFILGPSRSGKSTLERLVAAIAGIERGYEARLVERAARRTAQMAGLLATANPDDLPAALGDRLRENFAAEVRSAARGGSLVTDTYPAMIAYVGRVAAVLPGVRFVFVRREWSDLALRILMKRYRSGNHYAYDLSTVLEYLAWYERMSEIWLEKLPGLALAVSYEEMIADPGATLARIARLCGRTPSDATLPGLGADRGCARPYPALVAAAALR